jgi:mycofactocin system glycosyltransferase
VVQRPLASPPPHLPAPSPPALRLSLDPDARLIAPRLLAGGSPRRVLRLSAAGVTALRALHEGRTDSQPARVLGRRLLDAGMAHPRPVPRDLDDRLTVVIPVRDRPEQLARCLAAVGRRSRTIVVDDGSLDAAAVAALAARHGAKLIRRPLPGGPAAARNHALAQLTTELVAFLDSDCVPPEDWLRALVGHFDDTTVAAVAPRVRPAGGAWQKVRGGVDREGPLPREPRGRSGALGRYLCSRSPLDMGAREAPVWPGASVTYVPSAALLVRRAALEGGFDEDLRYGEDVDLVWRLHDAGWRVRYDPAVEVSHEEPPTLRAALARRFRYGTAAAALSVRHPGRLHAATLPPTPVALVRVTARLERLGVPRRIAARWSGEAVLRASLSLVRYAGTIGAPVTLAIARRGRGSALPAVLGLLALPVLAEWSAGGRELDALRWSALALVDDATYAAGVCWGCVVSREPRPLLPRAAGRTGWGERGTFIR